MFSLEKIKKLFNDSEDFTVQQFIMAVNFGDVDTVGAIFELIREFLLEKRQDDLLELVDFFLENHFYQGPQDDDSEDFEDCISTLIIS